MKRPLVFIPTYNERSNVGTILKELCALEVELDILFLDDNSPDGTGEVLDKLVAAFPQVSVIHRAGKQGIGSAHQEGIRWAYEKGYRVLITMDCDFTHPTCYIPDFIAKGEQGTVVVGSRYVRHDSLQNWDLTRIVLTHLGHFMTKYFLCLPYDATGAYRLYRLDKVPHTAFLRVRSPGYSFFFESLYLLHRNGFPIEEVGITLPARTRGYSKMTFRDAFVSARTVWALWWAGLTDRKRFLIDGNKDA
ncbi:MAG: polyprenol monophosphomannose synthase [Elusimicrobiota bacterium]